MVPLIDYISEIPVNKSFSWWTQCWTELHNSTSVDPFMCTGMKVRVSHLWNLKACTSDAPRCCAWGDSIRTYILCTRTWQPTAKFLWVVNELCYTSHIWQMLHLSYYPLPIGANMGGGYQDIQGLSAFTRQTRNGLCAQECHVPSGRVW